MNQILITGGSGFVGKNVIKYFAEHQTGVIHDSRDVPPKGQFDFIINLASISSVEYSISHPHQTIDNNISLTLELLELARKNPPKLFIQFSSIETQNITNPYAASKKAQEDICLAYSRTYDIPMLVIHSTNIVGPGQSAEKFVPKLIKQIEAGEPVTIYTTNGAVGSRWYNPIKNVAEYLHQTVVSDGGISGYTEDEIPGAEKLDNLQMAQKIAKLMDKDALYRFVNAESIRPSYLQEYQVAEWDATDTVQTLDEALRELI